MFTRKASPLSVSPIIDPDDLLSFERYVGNWFRRFYDDDNTIEADYLRARIHSFFGNSSIYKVVKNAESFEIAIGVLKKLDWDSEYFGTDIYAIPELLINYDYPLSTIRTALRILYKEIHKQAKKQGAQILFRRLRAGSDLEIDILESFGYVVVDEMSVLTAKLSSIKKFPHSYQGLIFRAIEKNDYESVKSIMMDSFPLSRFNKIANLKERGDGVYVSLLANQLNNLSSIYQGVVAEVNSEIVGFSTWSSANDTTGVRDFNGLCFLELFVVAQNWRGRGIGARLLSETMNLLQFSGFTLIEASTWTSQIPAMSTYEKMGFRSRDRLRSYYFNL